MTMSLSERITGANRTVRQFEEDRRLFLKRFADLPEAKRELAIKSFKDARRRAKRKLKLLLAEQDGR